MSQAPVMEDRRTSSDRRKPTSHPLAADLRAALVTDTLELRFQPQFACADNALVGAEALVRWEHGVQGSIAGDALFFIAGESGLAQELGSHVRRAALAAAAQWRDDLRLSINITAADLARDVFVSNILSEISDSGFPATRLTLEITEQALVDELERSAGRLARLAEHGVAIALDDFGAGFCNFRYLKILPLDTIKLDRSMIEGIARDRRDLAVLRGIVAMAHALDLKVVAEGVETEAQRQAIREEGCASYQGFIEAEPMAAAAFARMAAA